MLDKIYALESPTLACARIGIINIKKLSYRIDESLLIENGKKGFSKIDFYRNLQAFYNQLVQ